jgi:hypothetical protein
VVFGSHFTANSPLVPAAANLGRCDESATTLMNLEMIPVSETMRRRARWAGQAFAGKPIL